MIIFYCLNCNTENTVKGRNYKNKYCNNSCQQEYQIKILVDNWLNGEPVKWHCVKGWAKRYIIEIRGYNCEICKLSTWNNLPITLECDHIDGNHTNNKINNLRLICPNCHSQTPTYKAKNKGNGRKERYKLPL